MTPKEEAKRLYEKFYYNIPAEADNIHLVAIKCAIACVDELIVNSDTRERDEHWREVRLELKKLA